MDNKKKHLDARVKENAVNAVLNEKQSVAAVAKTLKVHRSIIYRWIDQFQEKKSLEVQNKKKRGPTPKINEDSVKSILAIIKKPAIDFGYDTDFWTTRRIVQVVKKELSISLSQMSIYRLLIKCRQSYKKPESRYYEADKKKQEEWKNKVVPEIKAIIEKYKAILYFQDEANISLTPVLAKTWGPIGVKIIKKKTGNRGSISVISAISHDGRLIFNVHDKNKRYCAADIVHFLSQMLLHHPRRHLVVVMDQAPCHKAKLVQEYVEKQKRLHVFYLPPRSPEFNPDEKVWNHLKNQELKSHQAKTQSELKKITKKALNRMSKNKRVLRGIYKRSDGATLFN
jgi:transposase